MGYLAANLDLPGTHLHLQLPLQLPESSGFPKNRQTVLLLLLLPLRRLQRSVVVCSAPRNQKLQLQEPRHLSLQLQAVSPSGEPPEAGCLDLPLTRMLRSLKRRRIPPPPPPRAYLVLPRTVTKKMVPFLVLRQQLIARRWVDFLVNQPRRRIHLRVRIPRFSIPSSYS